MYGLLATPETVSPDVNIVSTVDPNSVPSVFLFPWNGNLPSIFGFLISLP